MLSKTFPSKFLSKKVKKDEEEEESEEEEEEEDSEEEEEEPKRRTRTRHKNKKGHKKSTRDDAKDFNIIFTSAFDEDEEDEEENIDQVLNDENEECNSDDEKTFMKESYEEMATQGKNIKDEHVEKGKKDKKKEKDLDVEGEYLDLQELKKHLMKKLEKKPESKILIHTLQDCKEAINELVKKARSKNAKKYYELVRSKSQNTCEVNYFKTKLSHKEQTKIMSELEAVNNQIVVDKPYRLLLLQSKMPLKYKATVMQKLNTMEAMERGDPEYYKLKNWVDSFMRVPFDVYKNLSVRMTDGPSVCNAYMRNAKHMLDECVYGLENAKLQTLQMIGQWIANPSALGTAIAISGSPGTGKTSLVKDGISKILGREFAFIALGGAGDASFLEGHSYTYEGSIWGKIVQILMDCKCMNPVIYFDELDKISDTPRGQEIASVLTHLTDTTQNSQFHDKYFSEIDFDLSKCLFIFSYNDESKVNPILKDRMYRIQTKGYDTKEKIIIAKKYILPKIREQVNFDEGQVIIPDDTISYLVSDPRFTQNEEGVRNLKRCLEIIHTKLNLFRLVDPKSEREILGKEIDLKVQFPYTVTRRCIDVLIKNDEKQNQSLLSMYV